MCAVAVRPDGLSSHSHPLVSNSGSLPGARSIPLDHRSTESGTTQQAMASLSLKLAFKAPLLFLLLGTQVLRPVASQSSSPAPAPTPCKGAISTAKSIKDGYIFWQGLSPSLDPGLNRTLPNDPETSNAWPDTSQSPLHAKN
jgi:hypothetical protein